MAPVFVGTLVFAAVCFLAVALLSTPRQLVRGRLERYGVLDTASFDSELARPFAQRVLLPILGGLAGLVARITPAQLVTDIERRLQEAGNPWGVSPNVFLASKAALLVLLPSLYGAYLLLNPSNTVTGVQLAVVLGLAYIGFRGPEWWLDRQIGQRQTAINRSLPDALDLIVICTEAGLAFEGAMARVAGRMRGPLAGELQRTLGEIGLGVRRRDALRELAARTRAHDLVTFIAAVVQAEQTGISIGDVLRVQAEGLRLRRRQRAEREGRESPMKLLLPLIFFIFPATIIVVIGPAGLRIIDYMGNGGG